MCLYFYRAPRGVGACSGGVVEPLVLQHPVKELVHVPGPGWLHMLLGWEDRQLARVMEGGDP